MNEELMPDEEYLYPYQYPYEPLLPYPAQYQPDAWYPMSVYQPLFWAALLGGIVQVAGAIMAAGAVDVRHPEKVLTHSRSAGIDVILIRPATHASTHEPVDLTHLIAISALHGDQLAGHLVVRFPVRERIANPGVQGENTLLVHRHLRVLARVLEQVAVVHGPFVQPLGGIDKFVN